VAVRAIERLARYVKADVWRPDERRTWVRKRRPGVGWTVNLAAVRSRFRGRGA